MRRFNPSALSNPNYSYPNYRDGRMVRGSLYNMLKDARKLRAMLTDDDDLPQWVSLKVFTADDRLQCATRYMERAVALAKENTNYRYSDYKDGEMVRDILLSIEKDASILLSILTDEDDLPQWISMKIYTAEDQLKMATRYMEQQISGTKARSNTGEEDNDFYSPTNVAVVAAFLILGGYIIRSRMESK